jgi:hypothetical protein
MSDEPTYEPWQEDARRKAAFRAKGEALADMAASVTDHRPVHDQVTRNSLGITGMTGQQAAAEVARRAPTVGSGLPDNLGRALEYNGGLYDHHVSSPHPQAHDMRFVDRPGNQQFRPNPLVQAIYGDDQ